MPSLARPGLLGIVLGCLFTGAAWSHQDAPTAPEAPPAPLILGGGDTYEPFHFLSNGQPAGFDVELAQAVARVMGLDLTVYLDDWQVIRDALATGRLAGHVGMTHSAERADRYRFSAPYLSQQYKIFVRRGEEAIRGEGDLPGQRIIVQRDGVMDAYVRERRYSEHPLTAADAEEALRLLAAGQGDCCLMSELRGLHVAQKLGLHNLVRVGEPVYRTTYGFALSPEREAMIPLLNQGLVILKKSGEYDRIYAKWFGVLEPPRLTTRDYLRAAGWVILPLLAGFLVFSLWSWSLRRQVIRQTAQLRLARDQAQAASNAKSSFLATMSHEIRTPLNAVLGMSELLLASDLNDLQCDQTAAIRSSARMLQNLIDDILEFARADAGERPSERIEFSLPDLVERNWRTVEPAARDKGLLMVRETPAPLPERVLGDASALGGVLTKLLQNSVKFTLRGGVTLRLEVRPLDDGRLELLAAVRDTGIGVPVAARASLFDPFTQADSSSTRRYGGAGLGLALCRALVEQNGGRIEHDAAVTPGSLFRFSLVLEAAAAAVDAAPAAKDEAPYEPAGRSVLVVEDNLMNQRVVAALLKKWGYAVEIAADGREAVAACRERRFAAVLMDIQMPAMDGLAATRAIRAEEASGRRVPIIALTAGAQGGGREACLQAGMDDYLTKPVNGPALSLALREWIQGRRAAAPAPS